MSPDASTSFPAASGRRTQWHEMPERVRAAVEDRFGARVVEARSQAGGFSPGVAARLVLDDGSRAFLKAVSGEPNRDSPDIHRREARIAAALPRRVPAPPFRWSLDDGEWVVLAFDDVDGRAPRLPWRGPELQRVLDALQRLADALTPSPVAADSASEAVRTMFGGWQRLADDGATDALAPDARARLRELVALEAAAPDAVRGDALVHLDLRADNLLLTADEVYVVDWPWAAVGASWIDLAAMLPSIAMQGGGEPEAIWSAHPVARGVNADLVDAFVAGLAGFFADAARRPPAPGIPTLRAFQRAQGDEAIAWLATRRGWRGDFRSDRDR